MPGPRSQAEQEEDQFQDNLHTAARLATLIALSRQEVDRLEGLKRVETQAALAIEDGRALASCSVADELLRHSRAVSGGSGSLLLLGPGGSLTSVAGARGEVTRAKAEAERQLAHQREVLAGYEAAFNGLPLYARQAVAAASLAEL